MKGDLDSYFTFTVGWKQFHVADRHKNVTLNKTGHKTDKKETTWCPARSVIF